MTRDEYRRLCQHYATGFAPEILTAIRSTAALTIEKIVNSTSTCAQLRSYFGTLASTFGGSSFGRMIGYVRINESQGERVKAPQDDGATNGGDIPRVSGVMLVILPEAAL